MFFQFFSWFLLLIFLSPLLLAGIIILQKTTKIDRFEILFPVGSIFGVTLFTFLINFFSYIKSGQIAIFTAFITLIIIGIIIYRVKIMSSTISFPSGKALLFYLSSIFIWAFFIFWKGNHALIGSDTNLYFAVAHTFIKGNFPPFTPWQPDIPLQYHLGPFELLGAFYLFTNLAFEFLHVFFSSFFIFLTSQIIIWFWKRHTSWLSFIWGNISALIILVSFGFFKVIIPIFPLDFPNITNFHQLFLWIRNLPTVNQVIEVYGAPINLDGLIYFIFHSFGLALFLSLLVVIKHSLEKNTITVWIILLFSSVSLAFVNESIFIAAAPALLFWGFLKELQNNTLLINFKKISILVLIAGILVLIQGGVITNYFFQEKQLEKSILLFPKKQAIKGDFMAYHYNQEISKALPQKMAWLPFDWSHIGVDLLIAISLLCIMLIKYSKNEKLLILTLFLSGFFSLLAYNFVVPKFLIANGNRFLSFSFIFLSLSVLLSINNLTNLLQKSRLIRYTIVLIFTFVIILPTILPPLFLLSINRFGENKLIPKQEDKTPAIEWIEKNLPYNTKIMVLDARSPHPSGQARAMVQAGVFAPIFPEQFRAYTIEASPEYFDIAYYLSPIALKKLKINTLLIDNVFFETLPDIRRQQIANNKYFEEIFERLDNKIIWEKVYKINEKYLKEGKEIDGTFEQLKMEIPKNKKIYIDSEDNFSPSYLRRAVIFSLRDRELYFLPQSGVYLNVEATINLHPPLDNANYDYLVLSKKTDPETICNCQIKLIWKGIKDEVYVWKMKE